MLSLSLGVFFGMLSHIHLKTAENFPIVNGYFINTFLLFICIRDAGFDCMLDPISSNTQIVSHKNRNKCVCASALQKFQHYDVFATPNFNAKLFGHIFRTQSRPIANVTMLRSSSNRHHYVLYSRIKLTRKSVFTI